jgi:uncharacterized small protein (DUF1192 family)
MNIKENLKAIFQKFNINPEVHGVQFSDDSADAVAEIKLSASGKLADGTEIYSTADAWGVGVDVFTKDADGNPVALVEGEYTLEDGSTISVGADGMIAEIMPAEAEKEEMSSDDLLAVIDSLSNRVSALESERTELSAQLADATQSKDAVTTELANTKTELSALKKAPAATSVRENFNRVAVREAVKKESVSEMMERLRSNK